jgi:lipopolysaccharide transport system permease protein
MFADLAASRELAWRFATRDIKAQYRDSFLGFLWAFITPVMSAATWLFLNAAGIVRVADTDIPYAAYVFTGTMLWQVFTEALNTPLGQINAARAMLAKLNFPRESLLLSGLLKLLYNAGIKVAIMLPVIMVLGVWPDWHILLFPLGILTLALVGFTIGLLIAPVGMLYSDIGRVLPILTQVAMYTAPVVFAMPKSGLTATLFSLNFMTPVILTSRAWLTGFASPMPLYFAAVAAVALVLLVMAWFVFRITMPVIIERMSA